MSTSTPSQQQPQSQPQPQRYHFSHYDVTDQVFLRTPHAIGIVNVKPIVPGHVLLIPPNPSVHRLADLPSSSIGPFFSTLQTLVARLEKAVGATSSTVAIQDGEEAGQSVKHLHVHVLPRRKGDFTPSDEVYAELEAWGFNATTGKRTPTPTAAARSTLAPDPQSSAKGGETAATGAVDEDEARPPRTREEMQAETQWLKKLFQDLQ